MLHIFSTQALTILFLSVVVLKCVNINIEAHSFKNIVHFVMVNIRFCLNFDLWNNLIQ